MILNSDGNPIDGDKVFKPDTVPITADYQPSSTLMNVVNQYRAPPFTLRTVSLMLPDPRLTFGLYLLKGPITASGKLFCQAEPAVKAFIKENFERYWRNSAIRTLRAIEWGFSCSEVLYTQREGMMSFDTTKDVESMDCKALTHRRTGKLMGAAIRGSHQVDRQSLDSNPTPSRLMLTGPKCLWHVQGRDHNPYYGRSRFFGAYLPWIELWGDGNYRDSRKLFFHKLAYDGGQMYHPPGNARTVEGSDGAAAFVSNKDLARQMLEKKRNGAGLTLPNIDMGNGFRAWEYVPPQTIQPPAGLMDYGELLKDEMLEGMGIPPEVASASGTGAYAGRMIPQQAYYAVLQEIFNWLVNDVSEQIIAPLVRFNFGHEDFELTPLPLLETEEEERAENRQEYLGDVQDDVNGDAAPNVPSTPSQRNSQKTNFAAGGIIPQGKLLVV